MPSASCRTAKRSILRVARPEMNVPSGLYFDSCRGHWNRHVLIAPSERRVLVRAREIEGIHRALEPRQDHLILAIDRDAVCRRNRVFPLVRLRRQHMCRADRQPIVAHQHGDTSDDDASQCGLEKPSARRAPVAGVGLNVKTLGHYDPSTLAPRGPLSPQTLRLLDPRTLSTL